MADDIVTRLREASFEVLPGAYLSPDGEVMAAAATRIERLEFEARKNTAEIERLQRVVKDRDEWNDHLSQTVSFLLLAVPRPFRMAVNRKAVRLLEEESRRG